MSLEEILESIGNFFGSKFKKPAEITGGVILILMGLKILCLICLRERRF